MSVKQLSRGQNCLLEESQQIRVEVAWQVADDKPISIDVSAFLLADNRKVLNDHSFIFYNQPMNPERTIVLECSEPPSHRCELSIQLNRLIADISRIVVVATIDQAAELQHDFNRVDVLAVTLIDADDQPLLQYQVEQTEREISLMMGEVYRKNGGWKFRAVGQGFSDGLGAMAAQFGVNIEASPEQKESAAEVDDDVSVQLKKGRRSPRQMLIEKSSHAGKKLQRFLPQISSAIEHKLNESNTRMILDKLFMDIFEYKMEEIRAEQKIQGRKADYVLYLDDEPVMVVEVKRAGMVLRNQQVFQATSYGAYSGIRWALLTNLQQWQLFYISTQDKVDADLIFSIDILHDMTREDLEKWYLLSRYGMNRKGVLDKLKEEMHALSHENMVSTLLSDDVINKVRSVIKRDTGCQIDNEKIQQMMEEILHIN